MDSYLPAAAGVQAWVECGLWQEEVAWLVPKFAAEVLVLRAYGNIRERGVYAGRYDETLDRGSTGP